MVHRKKSGMSFGRLKATSGDVNAVVKPGGFFTTLGGFPSVTLAGVLLVMHTLFPHLLFEATTHSLHAFACRRRVNGITKLRSSKAQASGSWVGRTWTSLVPRGAAVASATTYIAGAGTGLECSCGPTNHTLGAPSGMYATKCMHFLAALPMCLCGRGCRPAIYSGVRQTWITKLFIFLLTAPLHLQWAFLPTAKTWTSWAVYVQG